MPLTARVLTSFRQVPGVADLGARGREGDAGEEADLGARRREGDAGGEADLGARRGEGDVG